MADRTTILYERSGTAPIRAALVAHQGELDLFSDMDTKRIMVAGLRIGGEYYRTKYVPQLFTGRIYRSPFHYHLADGAYIEKKKALGLGPLESPRNDQGGHLKDAAINQSYVSVNVSGTLAKIVIHIPGAQHVGYNAMVLDVLKTVPAEWVADVAQQVATTISSLLSGAQESGGARSLSAAVRKVIGSTSARAGYASVGGNLQRRIPGHA